MTKLYARFLVAIVKLATGFLGRWRRLTVLARIHALLAPESTVTVDGISLTLLVPDRTSVYWPRHGFSSEPNTLSWIDGFQEGDVLFDVGANIGAYTLYAAKARSARARVEASSSVTQTGKLATMRGAERPALAAAS